jgi:hypothetical protein
VTAREMVSLIRRHLLAVLAVLAVSIGGFHVIRSAPMTYSENGTVAFTMIRSASNPNPYGTFRDSMIDTAGIVGLIGSSPQVRAEVQSDGGTASFQVVLIDNYNLQFPLFNEPYLTISASSDNPRSVHRTFVVVNNLLDRKLLALQSKVHVKKSARIVARLVADTGPQPQAGSSIRSLAALMVLTVVAVFAVATFLDRSKFRLRHAGWFRGAGRGTARRHPFDTRSR